MEPNRAALMRLLSPISIPAAKAANLIVHRAKPIGDDGEGTEYNLGVFTDSTHLRQTQTTISGYNQIAFLFYNCTYGQYRGAEKPIDPHLQVIIPMPMLTVKPSNYYMYHISFGFKEWRDENMDSPLCGAYIGITKRNPFLRLREHQQDAAAGRGHLLHKAWNALLRRGQLGIVNFTIVGEYKTLELAYAAEEALVDEHTLAPKGLNAIPGGMKGIRMMHQLRLLHGTSQISVEDRDRALVRLEGPHDRNSPCAHYRTGHFRNLPTGKLTWVSPCWVNPPKLTN